MARGGDELGEGFRRTRLASERTFLGVAFAVLGVGLVGYGALRQTLVGRAIRRGEYVELDGRAVVGLAAAMIVLGIALAVLVVFRRVEHSEVCDARNSN
jgi:uncharacterized membrane protein YidH (DUF202 family)